MILFVRKLILLPALTLFLTSTVAAQALFTYDGREVSKEDFLKAYNKNNTGEKASPKSYREYLDLYIRYKLKVRAAYDLQMDTLAGQRTELQNFRTQVAENYMKDQQSLDKLVSEVYLRGQKDLRIAHIFIALPRNATPADTAKAHAKAWEVYNELKRGKKFPEAARSFSDDPSVRTNAGDIGYITVFTLPYELENLAYATPAGQFSKPFRSKGGYHIFKVVAERRSLGRIKVAQILVAVPPGASGTVRQAAHARADSIHALLRNGADFATLAHSLSGDNLSYLGGGEMPEFGIGKYDSTFEAAAFGLDKDGAISEPISSPYGYHIIKRLARKPFPHQWDKETAEQLRVLVSNDARIAVSRKALLSKINQQTGYTPADYTQADLWAFTDSITGGRTMTSYNGLTYSTPIFSLSKQSYTVKDWLDYAKSVKSGRPNGGNRTDQELFTQYEEKVALEYYRNHLEEYNKDFAFQLMEFKEGNLLFEIMQKKIWDKASTDSTGLRNFYESHKDKYWWESSADALLFTCSSEKTAENLKQQLTGNTASWRKLADSAGAGVQADSGRYELAQIPVPARTAFSPGLFTAFFTNKADNTVTFSYILNVYNERAPRNYRDARGFVINDYQLYLEDQWIVELKKKYPVKVDETALNSLK